MISCVQLSDSLPTLIGRLFFCLNYNFELTTFFLCAILHLSFSNQRKSILSNTIVPFQFDGYQIRVVLNGGEPWFVAKDVCQVLEQPNISQVVLRLKAYEKGIHIMDTL